MSGKNFVLSNAELMLLQIVLECQPISGYDLNKLVEEKNIRVWADLGTTSIYLSLKKLDKKELITGFLDKKKTGKGPPPKKYSVTNYGKKVLTNEILKSLSSSDENEKRFDIAFHGINFLPRIVVILALERRIEHLMNRFDILEKNLELLGESAAMHNKTILNHRMFLVGNEIEFMQKLLEDLRDRDVEL